MSEERNSPPLALVLLLFLAGIVTVLVLAFAGLSPSTEPAEPAGFWAGVLHGLIILGSLIVSVFHEEVLLYAAHLQGLSYNVGYYIGVSLWFVLILKGRDASRKGFDRVEQRILDGE